MVKWTTTTVGCFLQKSIQNDTIPSFLSNHPFLSTPNSTDHQNENPKVFLENCVPAPDSDSQPCPVLSRSHAPHTDPPSPQNISVPSIFLPQVFSDFKVLSIDPHTVIESLTCQCLIREAPKEENQ